MSDLLDGEQLESSSVVANSTMNRERELAGSNSYTRDLSFSPLEFLTGRLVRQERVAWLDLCCGTGRALIEAGRRFQEQGLAGRVSIVGVDLVAMFYPFPEGWSFLRLVEASLSTWEPEGRCDLITCVHGMHYVGDKMDLLRRASRWLEADGVLVAHLDFANVRLEDGRPAMRRMLPVLRRQGVEYDARKHLVQVRGHRSLHLPWRYLGADDQAGPNFTGQPAVNSWYGEA